MLLVIIIVVVVVVVVVELALEIVSAPFLELGRDAFHRRRFPYVADDPGHARERPQVVATVLAGTVWLAVHADDETTRVAVVATPRSEHSLRTHLLFFFGFWILDFGFLNQDFRRICVCEVK